MKKYIVFFIAVSVFTILITGCTKKKESLLEIRLTDAPTALEEVNVDIQTVRVKFDDDSTNLNGWYNLNTNARVYNLLDLQNGIDTVLATGNYPVATVKEIRFILGPNNTVKENGIVYPLTIPSGGESGLKIKISKDMRGPLTSIIIDFDAALSVKKESSGNFKLRPVLKVK